MTAIRQKTLREILGDPLSLISLLLAVVAPLSIGMPPLHAGSPNTPPPVRIAYFVPSDMEPIPDRQERLGRVMRCIRDFYRDEMDRNGYGPVTFNLEWESRDKLRLYTVRGKKRRDEYGRHDAGTVREEVREVLRSRYGIDIQQEVVVIFQLLLKWEGDKATEVGPYVGGGSHLAGTAWVYDDKRLDPDLLMSREPGGYYYRPCSLGMFNTHYLGGLAHEMGHAFGLPHVRESDEERRERHARALMGEGNHTFGRNLRNEGEGTFLTKASALRLSRVRAFAGDLPGSRERAHWTLDALCAEPHAEPLVLEKSGKNRRGFKLTGIASGYPKLVGVIAYNDNLSIPDDYDAKARTSSLDGDGRFRLDISELETAPYRIRLVGIHESGAASRFSFHYSVAQDKIDLSSINEALPREHLKKLFHVGNIHAIEQTAQRYRDRESLVRRARHLVRLLKTSGTVDVASLPKEIEESALDMALFSRAETGWGTPRRGHVPEDVFIEVGGEFFESGLFAHAPSLYQIDLDRKWKRLKIGFGLQDGHDGPVRFIIQGDDKELLRSDIIRDHKARFETIPMDGVKTLRLLVESVAPNGNSGAWSVWLNPNVER